MRNSCMIPVCKVSDIKFTIPTPSKNKRNNKIKFTRKKEERSEEKEDTPISVIRKHIESFIPHSCYSKKQCLAPNYNSCHR